MYTCGHLSSLIFKYQQLGFPERELDPCCLGLLEVLSTKYCEPLLGIHSLSTAVKYIVSLLLFFVVRVLSSLETVFSFLLSQSCFLIVSPIGQVEKLGVHVFPFVLHSLQNRVQTAGLQEVQNQILHQDFARFGSPSCA